MTGVVLAVFPNRRSTKAQPHNEEDNPCNLKPKLVQDSPQGPCRGERGLFCRTQRPAAAGLLFCHARHHSQLSCRRNLIHGSILTAFGATMAQPASAAVAVGRGRASKEI